MNHKLYYLGLGGILTVGLLLVLSLSGDRQAQMTTVIGMSIIYAAFGILHHALNHNLATKIMVEYILIAMLGIAISLFIFRGGFGF